MTDTAIKPITDNVEEISLDPLNKKHPSKIWLRVLLVLAVVAGILGYGIRTRMKAEADLQAVTTQMAVPSVSVVQPKHRPRKSFCQAIYNRSSHLRSTRAPMVICRSGISISVRT